MTALLAQTPIDQLPGGHLLQQLTNTIAPWALLLSLLALVISAVTWRLGANHNHRVHEETDL